jgi:tetratricopeptide (TPR) repeat protein
MRIPGWSALQVRCVAVVAACAALIALAAPASAAGGRAALVIAEAAYPDSDAVLPTPVGDAGAIAEALRQRGFTVTAAENVGREALQAAIDRFARTVEPDGVALVFFAGYGIQVKGRNYLIPVDARVWSEADVVRDGISLDGLMETLGKRQAGIRVVILDASRRNPFERRFRSFSQGLAPIAAPPGGIVIASAAAGGVAGDAAGPRGPFATELVRQIATDESVDKAFQAVRDAMAKRGATAPVPAITADLRETFSFDPDRPRTPMAKPLPAAEPKTAPPVEAKAPLPKADEPQADRTKREAPEQAARRDRQDAEAEAQRAEIRRAEERRLEDLRAAALKAERQRADALNAEKQRADALNAEKQRAQKEAEQHRGEQERQRLAELDDRIRRDPRDEVSYYERGQFHAQRGDTAAAIADFDQSIRLNPASPEAYNNRCWLHAVAGDLRQARADCDQALRLRPDFLDALDSRGLVNLKAGALQAAVSDYGEALKRDARHSSALYGRGLALKRLGDEAAGGRDMASAFALNPQIDKDFATYGVR